MKLSDLKYFVAVADELNFSKAAQKLFISQQALSKHIAQLESSCGTTLFVRKPRVQLTQSGEILYQYASKMLILQNEMDTALDDNRRSRHGKLSIGMSYARSRTLLPIVLPRFLALYPDIDFQLMVDRAAIMMQRLFSHDIDLFLGYNSLPQPALESVVLSEDTLNIVIPVSLLRKQWDNLPSTLEELDFSQIDHAPFLLYPSGNSIRELSNMLFSRHNIKPKIVLESLDNELQLALAAQGIGITFAPKSVLTPLGFGSMASKLAVIPIPPTDFSQKIQILYCKDTYLSRAARSFIGICQEILPDLLTD